MTQSSKIHQNEACPCQHRIELSTAKHSPEWAQTLLENTLWNGIQLPGSQILCLNLYNSNLQMTSVSIFSN